MGYRTTVAGLGGGPRPHFPPLGETHGRRWEQRPPLASTSISLLVLPLSTGSLGPSSPHVLRALQGLQVSESGHGTWDSTRSNGQLTAFLAGAA